MKRITLETIHDDLNELKGDVEELFFILEREPELREDVIEEVKKARKRMKVGKFLTQEEVEKEILGRCLSE